LVTVQEHVVLPAHFPVEECHPEWLAPFCMGRELRARRKEMAVGANLQFQPQRTGGGLQALLDAPLARLIARLNNNERLRTEAVGGGDPFSKEGAVTSCFVDWAGMNGRTSLAKCIPKMPHGA
jgi:hypothetical protein